MRAIYLEPVYTPWYELKVGDVVRVHRGDAPLEEFRSRYYNKFAAAIEDGGAVCTVGNVSKEERVGDGEWEVAAPVYVEHTSPADGEGITQYVFLEELYELISRDAS